MIKAIAGGGGRGMRVVDDAGKLDEAYARCQSEAMAAFGSDGVYVERLIRNARHIEVQIIGDRLRRDQPSLGARMHHPAPQPEAHRGRAEPVAERRLARRASSTPPRNMAAAANYDNLGTFEFLVDNDARTSEHAFAFIEANPRLQVEHTVTEEVLGLDLVQSQLAVAAGADAAARSGWRRPISRSRAAMRCSSASTWR